MIRQRKNERGVALFAIAIFMVVILGFTAVGIDVARLAHTATEVQTVADAAARAGAMALAATGGDPGTGIARAKQIGNTNLMNGELAPNADVVVDEGHYNVTDRQFECCTTNSPCCANGSWGDLTCTGAASCDKRTAVLASPSTDVDNLFAGVFDFMSGGKLAGAAVGTAHATTTVEKIAVALPSGPSGACQKPAECTSWNDWACFCTHGVAPCLPMAMGSCEFPVPCHQDSCELPDINMGGPNSDTANWHGFQYGHNTPTLRGFMTISPCGQKNGTYTPPFDQNIFGAGGTIDLTNGVTGNENAQNNPFALSQCLMDNNLGCAADSDGNITGPGGDVFTIPVFDQDNCSTPASGDATVVGYATIRLQNITGTGSNTTLHFETLGISHETPTVAGGQCFGTDCRITLAK